MRLHFYAGLALLLAASFASAQQCTAQIAVNAFNSHTKDFLYGLTPEDFDATAGHLQLQVAAVKPVFRNRVLVLLDAGDNPDKPSLEQMAELVQEAPPGMPVAFGIFAHHAAFAPGFITDPDLLRSAIKHVLAESPTLGQGADLSHALFQALDMFGPHQAGDTILLVTSGAAAESNRTMRRLHNEFRRRGTRLQLLMGLWPSPASAGSRVAPLFSAWDAADGFSSKLISLANSTGGALMGFMNSDWLHAASSGYMLTVLTPARMSSARNWNLRIRDAGNDVPPADLFYPEQIAPCAAPIVASLPEKVKPRP
ncbi:MAG TPA: hypothetical protein VFY05_03410 [Candidatus Angelobacter sp.]|nr:hypothetical protein [Candidatus Angelobacter sp.]